MEGLGRQLAAALKDRPGIKVAVLGFPYLDGRYAHGSPRVQEALTQALAKEPGVQVLERRLIDKALEEQRLAASGVTYGGPEIGRLLGAEAVVTGTIEDLDGGLCRVSARALEAATGEVLAAASAEIRRTWKKYEPRLDGQRRVELALDFAPTELDKPRRPDLLDLADPAPALGKISLDDLQRYEDAVQFEKRELDEEKIALRWEALGAALPGYRREAAERARQWRDFAASRAAWAAAAAKRAGALEEDFARLAKLLAMESVTPAQKSEFARRFLDAYGYDSTANPRALEARAYYLPRCVANGRLGYCYFDGSVAVDMGYKKRDLGPFRSGYACVGGKRINEKGEKAGDCENPAPRPHVCDKSVRRPGDAARDKLRFGLTSDPGCRGRTLLEPKYSKVLDSPDGLYAFCLEGKCGFAGPDGAVLIKPAFDDARAFSEGLAPVKKGERWGYVSARGSAAVPFRYDDAQPFSEGLAAVVLGGKAGFVDKNGREVVPPSYDEVWPFRNGFARVKSGGKWAFIDYSGRPLTSFDYDALCDFSEGLGGAQTGGELRYLDSGGREVFRAPYHLASPGDCCFKDGLALVRDTLVYLPAAGKLTGHYDYLKGDFDGVVARDGRLVEKPVPTRQAESLGEGFYAHRSTSGPGCVYKDASGRRLNDAEYTGCGPFSDGLAFTSEGALDRWGRFFPAR